MSVPDPTVTDWVPLYSVGAVVNAGGEIDYVERTTPVDITAVYPSATTILTGNAVTYDGLTRIKIEFFAYEILCTTSSVPYTIFGLYEDGIKVCDIWTLAVSTTGPSIGVKGEKFHTPSAGAHTYSIRGYFTGGSGLTSTVRAAAGTGGSGNHAGGPAFMRITAAGPLPGTFVPPTYGTTLPSAPLDGQEAVLVDSITNPSYQWRFRYNAGSSSAYKWEFIGGPEATSENNGTDSTTSATMVSIGTAVSLTVLRAGDYIVSWGYNAYNNSGIFNCQMGLSINGAAPAVTETISISTPGANQATGSTRLRRMTGLAASTSFAAQHATNGGNAFFRDRWLKITPVRVS